MSGNGNAIGNGNAAMVNDIKNVAGLKGELAANEDLKKLLFKAKGARQLAGTDLKYKREQRSRMSRN